MIGTHSHPALEVVGPQAVPAVNYEQRIDPTELAR